MSARTASFAPALVRYRGILSAALCAPGMSLIARRSKAPTAAALLASAAGLLLLKSHD